MNQIITSVAPYAAILSSVLSVAALGFILRLSSQIRDVYNDRISAAQDRNSVLEERLKLAEDKVEQIKSVDLKVTKVGAALGLDQFKEELRQGVIIRDIGDNFSGKIAGRDLIDTINRLGDQIGEYNQVVNNHKQEVGKIVSESAGLSKGVVQLCQEVIKQMRIEGDLHQYLIEMVFDRNPDAISKSLNALVHKYAETPWRLYAIVPAYQALDGCAVILRRPLKTERA
jgi:hypothetical protein